MLSKHPFLTSLIKISLSIFIVFVTSICSFAFAIGVVIWGFQHISQGEDTVTDIGPTQVIYGSEESEHKILSLPVYGVILGGSGDSSDPLGALSEAVVHGYDIKKTLRDVAEDDSIAGVVLDIYSPGGTIYGSKAIADGVAYVREKTGKPVVSFISGLAASGGYWAAVSADTVFADVGSTIGSVGVISGPFKYYDGPVAESGGAFGESILTERGIETVTISAGKYKDIGNPYRKMTDPEKQLLQNMVNREYDAFVSYVSDRRTIDENILKNDIGAQIYDSFAAKDARLIDYVGSKEDAYEYIAKSLEFPIDDFVVVEKEEPSGILPILLGALKTKDISPRVTTCHAPRSALAFYGEFSHWCSSL